MSDFIDENYEQGLRVMGTRHDVIGLKVYDKMDSQLPDIGMVKVQDLETQKMQWLDTSDAMIRHSYHQNFIDLSTKSQNIFKKAGGDLLHIRTDDDYVKILQKFFLRRKKR